MRILVLAPQWPDPPRQGAAIRNLHILRYLAARHRVTLLTFMPDGPVDRARLEAACERVELLPHPSRSRAERLKTLATSSLPDMAWRLHSPQVATRVRELCESAPFDAIHVEGIEMAAYGLLAQTTWSSGPRSAATPQHLVYDAHNAEYLLQRRAFTTDVAHLRRFPKALYSLVQWWRLRRFERRVCAMSDHVLCVSDADCSALARLSPELGSRTTLLPNGVDPEYWSPEAGGVPGAVRLQEDTLLFDGTMDFRPNVDAALWFAQEVWPLIKRERPQARFFIVGRNPAPAVQALGDLPGITVTGAVDDPRPWVAGATVYVVPMRMGGGVRLKLLQAMSIGCAIVSTPLGAEGVRVIHSKELLLARSAEEFARATLSLLADRQRRKALGRAARELAVAEYAWEKLLPALDAIYPVVPLQEDYPAER